MTYEERQQAICKECNIHDERCAYFTRNMQDDCPKITSRMVGWELGYKDAIDKFCEFMQSCEGYVVSGEKCNYDNFMKFMEQWKTN